MKYALYPGCALHGTSRDYGSSLLAACRALGIELETIPGWTCCGATPAHMVSDLLAVSLPAANLAKADTMGLDVMLPCAACYNRLAVARERLHAEPDLKAQVERALGCPVAAAQRTLHPLNVIDAAEVARRVTRPLESVKAVAYYGCLLTRPASISVDPNVVHPTVMDDLMSACGVQMLDWPFKTECCGATLTMGRRDAAVRLTARILQCARAVGADCVITACPLCQSNLDMRQEQVGQSLGVPMSMPVVFFTEVLALALGVDPAQIDLDRHIVSAVHLAAR